MATFNVGRVMLHKTLSNFWSINVRHYGQTGVRLTNVSGSSIRSKMEKNALLTAEDKRRFDSLLPGIVSCLAGYNDNRLIHTVERIKPVIDYYTPCGFNVIGMLTVAAYKMLSADQSEEQLKKACIVDWCLEMHLASLFISDDICDNSLTRFERPCWHRLESVGLPHAINDIMMLQNGVYWLLKTHFRREPYYIDLVELFNDVQMKNVSGQTMDIWISHQYLNFDEFTENNHDAIRDNKGPLLIFYLPMVSALYMAENPVSQECLQKIKKVAFEMGRLLQAKDDYVDCFGASNGSGTMGTDIEEGKCSWLIVNALKLVNEEDKALIRTWYGKKDPEMVKLVYDKYVELQLDLVFAEYEKETYDAISNAIDQLSSTFPTKLFHLYLNNFLDLNFLE